jgi:hypothetical protein
MTILKEFYNEEGTVEKTIFQGKLSYPVSE